MPKSKVRKKERRARRVGAPRPAPPAFAWQDLDALLPPLAFPEDLLGLDAPEHTQVLVDVVVGGPDRTELHRRTLRLSRRMRAGTRVELWGSDAEDLLSVHVTGVFGGAWTFHSRVSGESMNGRQAKDLLDFIVALTPPNQVALTVSGMPVKAWSPLAGIAASTSPPPALLAVIEAHAAIERALGIERAVPHAYTKAEVQDTMETAALLRGDEVVQDWEYLDWPVPLHTAHELLRDIFDDDGSVVVEVDKPWTWTLGKEELAVAVVSARYAPARLDPLRLPKLTDANRTESVTLRLIPAEGARLTVRLVEVADLGAAHGPVPPDQRWFWTREWQEREREVDAHIAAGRVTTHASGEDFLAHLDRIAT